MRHKSKAILVSLFISLSTIAAAAEDTTPDIVFTNGKIFTVNGTNQFVEAVAVKDGKFVEIGSTEDINKLVGERTRVVDLAGAFALPGFIDDHIHPAQPYLQHEGGALLFPENFDKQQIAEAVAKYLTG